MNRPPRAALRTRYQQAPYLHAEQRTRLRFWHVLLPWLLAKRIYGPYRLIRLTAGDIVQPITGTVLHPAAAPLAGTAMERVLDPLIERLLTPRALLSLGAVVVLIQIIVGTDLNEVFQTLFGDVILALILGPLGLVLVAAALVALALPGTRWTVTKLVVRPVATAVATVSLFAALVTVNGYGPVHDFLVSAGWGSSSYATGLGSLPLPVAILVVLTGMALGFWFFTFAVCAMFLIHRNSFNINGHPLMRPLAGTAVAWLVAAGQLLLLPPPIDLDPAVWHSGVLAGPLGVTATAVMEVVRLRTRQGVGFRGPVPGDEPLSSVVS